MPLSEQARVTRRTILEQAAEAFAERGYTAASMRSIAARAGVTQPLIHHYFGSKSALFEEVLRTATEGYDRLQSAQWARDAGDVRFFTEGLRVLFNWYADQRTVNRLIAWARLEGRLQPLPESEALAEKVTRHFRDAKEAAVLRDDVDVDATVLLIEAMYRGFWERAAEDATAEGLRDRVFEQSLDLLIRGMLTERAADQARRQLAHA